MKGAGGACKYLGIFFILSLMLQGICAAEESNGTNTNLNDSVNSTINGSTNETVIGAINGTINVTTNGTINNPEKFPSILLLPLFLGSLLFLCWLCRFFDRMNFCFVTFLLIALLLVPLRLHAVDLISDNVLYILIALILIFILFPVIYHEYHRKRNRDEKNEGGKSKYIIWFTRDEYDESGKSNFIISPDSFPHNLLFSYS